MKQHHTLSRRQLLGFAGAALCAEHAHAQHEGHGDHAHSAASPYAMLSSGNCDDIGLRCAASATPWLSVDGTLWLVYNSEGSVWVSSSRDEGVSFTSPIELARHGQYLDIGPDARPQIVGNGNGCILIAYDFFRDDQWHACINLVSSQDGGKTFSQPRALDANSFSQRFPVLMVDGKNRFFAAWVDKRLVDADAKKGIQRDGASIAYAWSLDRGETFGASSLANPDSCECCRIAVAPDPKGLPVLLYRALFEGSVRDHATQKFSNPRLPEKPRRVARDNWVTNSCPHHGPSLAVSSSGALHAAWFTQGRARSGVFYAVSRNGGNYSEPMKIGAPNKQIGRPYLLAIGSEIWLVWKEFDGKITTITMRHSVNDGKSWSKDALLAQTQGYSDHPLLITNRNKPFLSWLTRNDGYKFMEIR